MRIHQVSCFLSILVPMMLKCSAGHTVNITSRCPTASGKEADSTVEEVYDLVDMGKFTSLRRIAISFGIPDLYDERRHISLLARMLRNINKSPVEEVGLFLWHTPLPRSPAPEERRQRLEASGSWDVLDRVLASSPGNSQEGGRYPLQDKGSDQASDHGLETPPSFATLKPTLKSVKVQLTEIRDRGEGLETMAICLPRLTSLGVVDVLPPLPWIVTR